MTILGSIRLNVIGDYRDGDGDQEVQLDDVLNDAEEAVQGVIEKLARKYPDFTFRQEET